ncbi:unnamed protein product [Mytilus coruscus]|uniref:Tyrosinase copper-binding domain-containing protein n=1 Tax=Mytilus coruscus TaxID=42192 RepID=A0A6J8EA73_MYTCO|nr:unnamed protein product [Mytilus coruscus]
MELAIKIFFIALSGFCTVFVQSKLRPIPLPRTLKKCLEDKQESRPTLTDEEAIGTCMLDFMWKNDMKCGTTSQDTISWFAQLAVNRVNTTMQKGRHTWGRAEKKRGIRKEYRMITDTERNDYHRAVNALKRNTAIRPNKYDALVEFHRGLAGTSAHRGPAFLGWHRYFLFLYEQALQEEVPGVMLPYWASSLDAEMTDATDSVIWTDLFAGNGNGSVKTGPFANWMTLTGQLTRAIGQGQLMDMKRVQETINNHYNHDTFGVDLEGQHDNVHLYVGGQMGDIKVAPSDPIFFMHHAYVDCIWEQFREKLKRRFVDPVDDYPAGTDGHGADDIMINLPRFPNKRSPSFHGTLLKNKDGYRNFWTDDYYTCDPVPECSYTNPNCGSAWLTCNVFTQRCVSKGSAAALPKITPTQMMKVMYQCFPDRLPSHMKPLATPTDFPTLTYEMISSGEMFYSVIRESSTTTTTTHHIGKRALHNHRQRNMIQEIEVETVHGPRRFQRHRTQPMTGRPVIQNVTWPAVPAVRSKDIAWVTQTHHVRPTPRPIEHIRQTQSRTEHEIPTVPTTWTIEEFYIPEIEKPCDGYPIQNTFSLNCKSKTNLWVFVPVKVVHVRHGDVKYTNYKVDEDGLVKVRVTSIGLNYDGTYRDHVFVDNRQPVTEAITFIAVKDPDMNPTKVLFTAVDQCGIACRAYCRRTRGSGYEECSGAVELTSGYPKGYAKTYRDSARNVWQSSGSNIVHADENEIAVIFYCDYQNYRPKKLF